MSAGLLRPRRREERGRDERGSALVEFTWLALILMVPLVYVVLSVFEVQRGAFAASAAARAGARACALADSEAAGSKQATAVARRAFADQGIDDPPLQVRCAATPAFGAPGATVRVEVSSSVDLPLLPSFLGERARFALDADQTVPQGQFVAPPDGAR